MKDFPQALVEYMVYFHAERDYFECHEVMEEYWKKDQNSSFGNIWVGLIQLAVALYHQRRGNIRGARKMLRSAIHKLDDDRLEQLEIERTLLLEQLKKRLNQLENHRPEKTIAYEDLNIPLQKGALLDQCMDIVSSKQLQWGIPSPMKDRFLIHKHALRDRSEVIETRKKEWEKRQRRR